MSSIYTQLNVTIYILYKLSYERVTVIAYNCDNRDSVREKLAIQ